VHILHTQPGAYSARSTGCIFCTLNRVHILHTQRVHILHLQLVHTLHTQPVHILHCTPSCKTIPQPQWLTNCFLARNCLKAQKVECLRLHLNAPIPLRIHKFNQHQQGSSDWATRTRAVQTEATSTSRAVQTEATRTSRAVQYWATRTRGQRPTLRSATTTCSATTTTRGSARTSKSSTSQPTRRTT